MNEPIISPLILYLCNVLPNIQILLLTITIFIGTCIFLNVIGIFVDSKEINLSKLKKPLIALVIMILFTMLIPSEKTMLTMYVASLTTPENIENVGSSAKDTVDYIVEKIQELEEEGE